METLRLAIIGYGNAGRAFGKMLAMKSGEIAKEYGITVPVVAIVTRSKGTLIDPAGIDLLRIDRELAADGTFSQGKPSDAVDAMDVIRSAAYDVLVELTPINIETGQPAITHIETALKLGKDVITANKGPLAWAYKKLKTLAQEMGAHFHFESTVMDGAPVFNLASETLKLCRITEVRGVLNATTNYILGQLEKGVPFESAVESGKRLGFVEADPDMDIEGWDASAKLAALMNVFMDAEITPKEIRRTGISDITAEQIRMALREGKVFKLICHGRIENGIPVGYVRPEKLDKTHFFASVEGTAAAVSITTDLMGKISIMEHEHKPEIDQTAYGVLSDLVRIMEKRRQRIL